MEVSKVIKSSFFYCTMSALFRLFTLFLLITFVGVSCTSEPPQTPVAPEGMISVPSGETKDGAKIDGFFMDEHPVTVAEFRAFVQATGFVTQAETFGDAGVFDVKTGAWSLVKGATYEYPFGPDNPKAADDHPVTQVSWNDATAYAKWANKRLPTSEEWFYAAGFGRTESEIYSWGGDKWRDGSGNFKANFWQGSFPYLNTNEDGFLYTSPVGLFGKNALGLTDMGGNVWQWTSDWKNPKITGDTGEKLQVGGSYLCDPAVCHGFKLGNTAESTTETSLCHVGFRCVRDF
jgi:sulfatase modifying factor 1